MKSELNTQLETTMTYNSIRKNALEHVIKAISVENGNERFTSAYAKTYTDDEVDIISDHFKTISGDNLTNEIEMIFECSNPNTMSDKFKNLIRSYTEHVAIIKTRPIKTREDFLQILNEM